APAGTLNDAYARGAAKASVVRRQETAALQAPQATEPAPAPAASGPPIPPPPVSPAAVAPVAPVSVPGGVFGPDITTEVNPEVRGPLGLDRTPPPDSGGPVQGPPVPVMGSEEGGAVSGPIAMPAAPGLPEEQPSTGMGTGPLGLVPAEPPAPPTPEPVAAA